MIEKEIFDSLCAAESYRVCGLSCESGIGIYNEKRLHKILKRTVCDNEDCFEVGVGRYVADVLADGVISEIQCASLAPLKAKIEYYLKETEFDVRVVLPLIVKRRIIRAERETGEIIRVRNSPKKENIYTALAKLYPIRELLVSPRLCVEVAFIEAEEYRYSERMRFRKKGAYDAELFPTSLVECVSLCGVEDYGKFLPEELKKDEFSAQDFAALTPLSGRDVYSALNTLAALGLLRREKQGRSVRYAFGFSLPFFRER